TSYRHSLLTPISLLTLPSFYLSFLHDPPPTLLSTLSLHDALPILFLICRGDHPVIVYDRKGNFLSSWGEGEFTYRTHGITPGARSEGTRLNSSHDQISYAVFCLKKKKQKQKNTQLT